MNIQISAGRSAAAATTLLAALCLAGCGSPTAPGATVVQPAPTVTPSPSLVTAAPTASETAMPTEPPSPTPDETPSPMPDESASAAPPQFTARPLPAAPAPAPPAGTVIQPPFDAGSDAVIQTARADLATRRSIAVDAVEVVEVRSVIWPDGGLGCPHPDMLYPQVQVDGIFIRLRTPDGIFDYHGGGGRPPFLCERGNRE